MSYIRIWFFYHFRTYNHVLFGPRSKRKESESTATYCQTNCTYTTRHLLFLWFDVMIAPRSVSTRNVVDDNTTQALVGKQKTAIDELLFIHSFAGYQLTAFFT
ncbi:unnamed protein product [Clavelina lepadiformis]|uniref:Uncharacterized protein n=1 Tax=Clavelina lepadiformis TaxID=159417 RepID=A0ABP0EYD2_CLALP